MNDADILREAKEFEQWAEAGRRATRAALERQRRYTEETMSELTTVVTEEERDLTRKEAEALHEELRQGIGLTAIRLYQFWKRNGHKAMGMDFEDYCERIAVPRQTAYDWIRRVEITLQVKGLKPSDLYIRYTNEKELLVQQRVAHELHKIPDPDERRKVWNEIEALRGLGTRLEPEFLKALKQRVKTVLATLNPKPAPEPPKPSAFDTAAASAPITATAPAAEPQKPVVSSFTPPADEEPASADEAPLFDEDAPDFDTWVEALDTVLAWVQNQAIDGGPQDRAWAARNLCEIAAWIEQAA